MASFRASTTLTLRFSGFLGRAEHMEYRYAVLVGGTGLPRPCCRIGWTDGTLPTLVSISQLDNWHCRIFANGERSGADTGQLVTTAHLGAAGRRGNFKLDETGVSRSSFSGRWSRVAAGWKGKPGVETASAPWHVCSVFMQTRRQNPHGADVTFKLQSSGSQSICYPALRWIV